MNIIGEEVFQYFGKEIWYHFEYPINIEDPEDDEKYTPDEFIKEIDYCIMDDFSRSRLDELVDYNLISVKNGIFRVKFSVSDNGSVRDVPYDSYPINNLTSYRRELRHMQEILNNPLYDDDYCLKENCHGKRDPSGFCDTHKDRYKKEDYVNIHRKLLMKTLMERYKNLIEIKIYREFILEVMIPRGDEYSIKFTMIEFKSEQEVGEIIIACPRVPLPLPIPVSVIPRVLLPVSTPVPRVPLLLPIPLPIPVSVIPRVPVPVPVPRIPVPVPVPHIPVPVPIPVPRIPRIPLVPILVPAIPHVQIPVPVVHPYISPPVQMPNIIKK